MKCKNCTRLYKAYDEESEVENGLWCDKIFDSPDVEMERECIHYKAMTNADKIRAMSDEELAMTMMCPNENGLAEIECDKSDSRNCYECLLKWLQEKVEE